MKCDELVAVGDVILQGRKQFAKNEFARVTALFPVCVDRPVAKLKKKFVVAAVAAAEPASGLFEKKLFVLKVMRKQGTEAIELNFKRAGICRGDFAAAPENGVMIGVDGIMPYDDKSGRSSSSASAACSGHSLSTNA